MAKATPISSPKARWPSPEQIDVHSAEGQPLAPSTGETASAYGASAAPSDSAVPDANEYDVAYGSIDPRWDHDWWLFFADGGENLTLTMDRTSGYLDSFLVLYDPHGRQIAVDDDGNGNLNARINTVLPNVRGSTLWCGPNRGGGLALGEPVFSTSRPE